jgi:hypothetical protein
MASKLKLTELLHPDSAVAAITINADNSVTIPTQSTTNLAYTGTLTGGTGVVNIGSGQLVKDASGNVGIGTSSPGARLDVTGASGGQDITVRAPASASATLDLAGNGNTVGSTSFTIRQDTSGQALLFNRANTSMLFATNGTERMRIDSSGNLLVGTTSGAQKLVVVSTASADAATVIRCANNGAGTYYANTSGTADYPAIAFLTSGGGTQVGSIVAGATTTSYVTSSDYRLKENVAPMTGALEKVAALKPVTYTWKADGSAGQGFIAHELQEVVPDCVTGTKDAVDKDGKPQYQGVDTSFLIATLTAALQEQQALIQDLTTRLTTLEGN